MKLIKEITEHIHEELDGVCEYVKFASKVKNENTYIYDVLMEIIPQEIKHVELWHNAAVREINKTKEYLAMQGKEVPYYMLELWQDEHEQYLESMSKLKYKLELLKNS